MPDPSGAVDEVSGSLCLCLDPPNPAIIVAKDAGHLGFQAGGVLGKLTEADMLKVEQGYGAGLTIEENIVLACIGQSNRDGTETTDRLHAFVLDVSLLFRREVGPDLCERPPRSLLEKKNISRGKNAGADDLTPADYLCENVGVGRLDARESIVDQAFIAEAVFRAAISPGSSEWRLTPRV